MFAAPGVEHALYQTTPSQMRARPYGDPYAELEYGDEDESRASVISPWSIDQDVKKLLYDDASSSFVAVSNSMMPLAALWL